MHPATGLSPTEMQSPTLVSIALPTESEITTEERHKLSPVNPEPETVTSTPSPAGIVEPVRLNPSTVLPPVETVNPAADAVPPLAPVTLSNPSKLN